MSLVTLAGLTVLAAMAAAVVAMLRRWPLGAVTAFLLVVAFVPIWVLVPTPFISPSAASGMAGLVAVALALRSSAFRWTFADLLATFLLITATGPVLVGLVPFGAALNVLVIWCTAYAVGRLVLLHVDPAVLYAVVAVVFGLVAFLALVEFVTGWHGLSSWGPANGARVTWGTIQERAGLSRAEGAFGHAIALGSTLAITTVLTMQARLPAVVRLVLMGLMVAAIGATLSRGPLACLVIGVGLSLLFVPDRRVRELRPAVTVMFVLAMAALAPVVLGVFSRAGDEASGSAAYRGDLVSLLDGVELVGRSAAIQVTPEGSTYVGGFRSIDNQLLIFGLNFGWLMIALVLAFLALGVLALLSGRGSTAAAAMVAQAPALVTVALITQYAVFFWFVLGLAVAADQLRSQGPVPDPGAGVEPGAHRHRARPVSRAWTASPR